MELVGHKIMRNPANRRIADGILSFATAGQLVQSLHRIRSEFGVVLVSSIFGQLRIAPRELVRRPLEEEGEALRAVVVYDRFRHHIADIVENALTVEPDGVNIIEWNGIGGGQANYGQFKQRHTPVDVSQPVVYIG